MSLRKDAVTARPRGSRRTHRTPPFRRVLIANRGEIAVRITRACHELGSEAVVVYSDADADAVHVRRADAAVRIGPPDPAASYLDVAALVEAARRTGCDALHPGYGLLSEWPELARACASAGVVFVGPDAATLQLLGDKLAARRSARDVGVPIVPGTLDPVPTERPDQLATVLEDAREIGFPLLVKAAAGGGGRGMRRVEEPRSLPEALVAASREAAAAFGDGAVYLERVIEPARHVEVQLLGDGDAVVALGERDCSVQRRHQKLVEEGPAPGLDTDGRAALHELAVRLGRAAGLRSASTAEFLVDASGRPWFLEVNARLQVEHGVTELVAGVDLVHEQFRIAAGRGISARARAAAARAATPDGHAIEVRITAEDPGEGFRPSPGRVGRWREPGGPGVRVDSGVADGSTIPAAYDSLMAKVLVWAPDRPAALDRLRRALDELEVSGVQTNLPFLRHVATDRLFAAGRVDTGYVQRAWDPVPSRERAAKRASLAAALLARAVGSGRATIDGWPPDGASPPGRWQAEGRREATEGWPRTPSAGRGSGPGPW